MNTLLSTRELAEVLGVSTRTVSTWSAAGRIPRVRLGARTIRYELGAVLKAVRSLDPIACETQKGSSLASSCCPDHLHAEGDQ